MTDFSEDRSNLLPSVIDIARSAGQLILDIYEHKDYQAFTKSDSVIILAREFHP